MSNDGEELSAIGKAVAGFFAGIPVLILLCETLFLIVNRYPILLLPLLFWLGTLVLCPLSIRYGGKSAYASAKTLLAISTLVYSLVLFFVDVASALLPVMSVLQCWWLALRIGRLGSDRKKRKLVAERRSVLDTIAALEKRAEEQLAIASLIELVGVCGADVKSVQNNGGVKQATEVSSMLREKRELLTSLDKEIAALG